MTAALLAAVFGVLQGLRHALEPDHITAVATMALRQRSSRATVMYAFAWGLGHAIVLAALGAMLVVFRAEMPVRLTLMFEVAVGVVLVGLGLRALRGTREDAPPPTNVRRPLLVGIVHGLAGTGAITAIAVAGAPGRASAITALALYAAGAVIGMCLLAGAAGPLFARAAKKPRVGQWIVGASAVTSIGLGVVWSGKSIIELLSA